MSCCILIAFVHDIILVLGLYVEFMGNSVRHTYLGMSRSAHAVDTWVWRKKRDWDPNFGSQAEIKSDTLWEGIDRTIFLKLYFESDFIDFYISYFARINLAIDPLVAQFNTEFTYISTG